MKKFILTIYIIFSALIIPNFVFSGTAKLNWTANTEADFSFYRVYFGTASRDYGIPIQVTGKTEYIFTFADDGKKYYFAITSVDNSGNESGYSLEVTKTMASGPAPPTGNLISNLIVASEKPYVIKEGLIEGSQSYYDRTKYIYSGVLLELINATFIQTSHGDMSVRGNDSFISFDLNAGADVYIVLDDKNTTRPSGMENFIDTGKDFKFYRNMSLLKKSFTAGPVIFGTNTNGDMYTIIVVPVKDTIVPDISITSPISGSSYAINVAVLDISGTASDNIGVSKVTWLSDTGSGTASGTSAWSVSNIALAEGLNNITVKAVDAAGNENSTMLAVTYTKPDVEMPGIVITSPTSGSSYDTAQASFDISGTSSDNIGVSTVTWSNDTGGSGTAAGTSVWSVSNIALAEGLNNITVKAVDAAGNENSTMLAVTYTKPVIVSGNMISNLTVASGKAYVILDGLSEGSQAYYDRTKYIYSNVPSELINATFIQTSHSDMSIRGNSSFVSFNLDIEADIYIVLDDKNTTRPSGMESFMDTGKDFKFYRNMSVLKRFFNAGPVVFGTNTAGDMYTIIIVPVEDTTPPDISINLPTSLLTWSATQDTIDFSGVASDNTGVDVIAWANSAGGSGIANGTTNWSITGINLVEGINHIIVIAQDKAGNSSSVSLSVTYTKPVVPPVSGPVIINLNVASSKPYVVKESLEEGSQAYYDRTKFKYSGVPSTLLGAVYVQTSHRDMSEKDNDFFISFDLTRDAEIYIVLDDRNSVRPPGMEEFTDTGDDFKFFRNMSVLQKSFSAGQVVFGTNNSGDMYTIIIVE